MYNEPMSNDDLVDLARQHYPETPYAPFEKRQERDLLHQLANRLEEAEDQAEKL